MHIEQQLEFLDSLPALPARRAAYTQTLPTIQSVSDELPIDPNKESGTVGPDMMNIYVPGVSVQNREDVDNCKLLMQNAASQKYDMIKELHQWYNFYTEGLRNLGWTINKIYDQNIIIERTGLTMDAVAFDVLQKLVGVNAPRLAELAGKAVEGVKGEDGLIQIYNRNAQKGSQAVFDISPVWQTREGSPMMILSCTSVDVRESTRGILWWKSTTKSTTVKSQATPVYLNTQVYSKVRNKVLEKLGNAAEAYLDGIPGFQ
ncbi:hypothetical protein [Pseudomonas sp. UW4]|jgi:hypothetical protein|uniref:hypothetical protein n=1 Tax=Pseudomonas sp. UW4 TaxID=1207075 RepID=UPI00029D0F44|nr:hypothetical protein [Pseudomonas sp. UW4]AFY17706.1 hypothetical protein PputUW4_00498 [Pseudomonas sp. UW4]